MRPVSAAFLAALHGAHQMRAEARIVAPGTTGVDPPGTTIGIDGGDVVANAGAYVRATLDVTTPAPFPAHHTEALTPYGNEIFARRGIQFGNRSTEWVSLAYFRINTVTQASAPLGALDLACADRMAAVVDARLPEPRAFPAGTSVEAVFTALVTEAYPGAVLEFDYPAAADTVTRQTVAEDDRHAFLRELADSRGKDFYVDHRGIFVVRDRPDPTMPVWEIASGEGGVLVSAARELTRIGAYNAVVVNGLGADSIAPVRGLAFDDSPASPTRWGGPFGRVPRFYSSPFVSTDTQARNAAEKLLRDGLGLPFSLDFAAVPNPALEPFDVVRVRIGTSSYEHAIESVTVPLTAAAPVTARTKDQTLISIGVE